MSTTEGPALSAAQRHLLSAATEAFAELGFGGTSTRDIAARANRSAAAVYVHFGSKEELLFAISLWGHQRSLACLRQASEAVTEPAERLHHMVRAFTTWHMDNARLGRVVQYEFNAMNKEHRDELAILRRQIKRLMVQALKDGVQTGVFEVDDLGAAADALLSLAIDLVRWVDADRKRGQSRIAGQRADLAVRMVLPRRQASVAISASPKV